MTAALLTQELDFMYPEHLNTEQALVFAFNTRVSAQPNEPRT